MIEEKIPEQYAFLFVGTWTKGGIGEDRKDIGNLIKTFYETFSNQQKQPALLLKTQGAGFSILDKEEILTKISNIKNKFPKQIKLPPIYFLHGDLSDEEMNYLYNHPKIKSMVSFTHGEGFGRPLLEATMTGLPVIASNWSGHTDFLDEEYCVLLGGTTDNIPPGAVWENVLIPESQWFNVNMDSASQVLKFAHKNAFDMKVRAKKLMKINRDKFTHSKMTDRFKEILEKYTSNLSVQVPINLPKLESIKSSPPKPVKLPKLEKV
jgi:glycosyltransferase involved in cell wall biosynthesis